MRWLITFALSYLVVQCTAETAPNPDDVYRSLAFVFDTTGSMYDDYDQLKSHAEEIMTYVQKRNDTDIKHFVFVPFNDPDVGPVSVTYNPKVIMYELNRLTITGGGDCPEMSITAVVQALKAVKPNSYVYVFTDASPKDSDLAYEALELIQRKQTQVVFLSTGENCRSTDNSYESIASIGSGMVFDIYKHDVSKVLEFVKKSMDMDQVNLMSVNVPQEQLIPTPKKLDVDESIKNLMVSVSGLNSNIEMVNPVGTKMDEAQGLITDLDLKNVKIVNIMEPLPGEWTLYVTSESAHTIRACGISDKNFNFGFATAKPKNLKQTSHRPLKGAKNYVLIDCPGVKKFLSCNVQDLNSDGKTKSLPIIELGNNTLLCGPFIPDNNPFYIQVLGVNNNDNYFKRITKTSILPDEPDTPYITTQRNVIAVFGEELRIKCRVESLVPFTATWDALKYPHRSWNFSQSSEIELLIRNVTLDHAGVYTCEAKNLAGSSESTTNVTVISKPMIAEGTQNVTIVLDEGDDYAMTCTGHGIPPPKMIWEINNSPISYRRDHILIMNDVLRLIIYDATLSDSNVYTCRALNEAGEVKKHYNVTVKVNTNNSVANTMLVVNEFEDVHLSCPLPNPNVKWFKDNVNINDIVYKRADEPHFRQVNNKLKIYDLDPVDSAIYTCKDSEESYTFDLRVAFAPYFTKYQPETMMVKRNEPVVFDCTTKGYPKPTVMWRKIDSAIPITQWTLKGTEFSENKQILKINAVDWIHNGTYTCIVKNKLGIDKRRFDLVVF